MASPDNSWNGYEQEVHRERNFGINWNHSYPAFRGAAALSVSGVWYSASFGTLAPNTWYHFFEGQTVHLHPSPFDGTSSHVPGLMLSISVCALRQRSSSKSSVSCEAGAISLFMAASNEMLLGGIQKFGPCDQQGCSSINDVRDLFGKKEKTIKMQNDQMLFDASETLWLPDRGPGEFTSSPSGITFGHETVLIRD